MARSNLTTIARGLVDAFNKGDWEQWSGPHTDASVYDEVGTQRRLQGREEILRGVQSWKTAMPDVHGKVTSAVASGKSVVLEITWDGTQTGPLTGPGGTIPPSGKRAVTSSAWVIEFDGDKVKESRHYFDMLSFLQQIDALPR